MRQHVVQLDAELLVFVLCVRIVHFSDLAEEVEEFRILKLIHSLSLTDRIDDSHETLGEDDTQDLIGHVELQLAGEGHAFLKGNSLLLRSREVIVAGPEYLSISRQEFAHLLVGDQIVPEVHSVDALRVA